MIESKTYFLSLQEICPSFIVCVCVDVLLHVRAKKKNLEDDSSGVLVLYNKSNFVVQSTLYFIIGINNSMLN